MPYIANQWENLPSTATPLSAERLANLETQYIEAVTDAAIDATVKADTAQAAASSYTDAEVAAEAIARNVAILAAVDAEAIARNQAVSTEMVRAVSAEELKAPLASPAFTGNPTAPTPTGGDSDTSIATTGFVASAVASIAGAPSFTSMTTLRAATSSVSPVNLLGYYATGDGGGGVFYWDGADTTSVDNGGTVITPTSALSTSGRWKRVYSGEVNARWFGVNPSLTDNTAQLQSAVTFMCNQADPGGVLYIPYGYYRFAFTDGTSGLSTITIDKSYLTIRGDGIGTQLTVRSPVVKVDYFFTFRRTGARGTGGGVRDLAIGGNSQTLWAVYLDSWRFWTMEGVKVWDVHGGLLDAQTNQVSNGSESITIRRCDYTSSSGTNPCLTQYGIRFRHGDGTWSDIFIQDCLFINCWDTGVMLDCVTRSSVYNVVTACNSQSTNTIDGLARAGSKHCVHLTNTYSVSYDSGRHHLSKVHLESHYGTETADVNNTVLIDMPEGKTNGYNRLNNIWDVSCGNPTGSETLGLVKILQPSTVASGEYRVSHNTVNLAQRIVANHGMIQIGPNVDNTHIKLVAPGGSLSTIQDQGRRTYINGVANFSYAGSLYPDSRLNDGSVNPGSITRDSETGRVFLQDKDNASVLIGPRNGLDVVSPYGAQRIQSLSTPLAPTVENVATGTTTWTYYVVAIDKDGNKTPPSPVGTLTTGPATLTSANPNRINWAPIDGAVKYDLLKGTTVTSVALGLVASTFKDTGISTAAYTPSAVNPYGDLTVDGRVQQGSLVAPTMTAAAGMGTTPGTITPTGDDQAGSIVFTTGTAPATGAGITVTFSRPLARTPKSVILGKQDASSISGACFVAISSMTTTGFVISFGTAPAASTTYRLHYQVNF